MITWQGQVLTPEAAAGVRAEEPAEQWSSNHQHDVWCVTLGVDRRQVARWGTQGLPQTRKEGFGSKTLLLTTCLKVQTNELKHGNDVSPSQHPQV